MNAGLKAFKTHDLGQFIMLEEPFLRASLSAPSRAFLRRKMF
jgi:hypothetical protein